MSGSTGGLDRVFNHAVLQRDVLLLHSQGNVSPFSCSRKSEVPTYFRVLCRRMA